MMNLKLDSLSPASETRNPAINYDARAQLDGRLHGPQRRGVRYVVRNEKNILGLKRDVWRLAVENPRQVNRNGHPGFPVPDDSQNTGILWLRGLRGAVRHRQCLERRNTRVLMERKAARLCHLS